MVASVIEQRLSTPARVVATVALSLSGAATMAAILGEIGTSNLVEAAIFLGAAALGAGLSAQFAGRFFGQSTWAGWGVAAFGAVLATTIGAGCGGLIWALGAVLTSGGSDVVHVPSGAVVGPAVVWSFIANERTVALAWAVSSAGVHLAVWWSRRVYPRMS